MRDSGIGCLFSTSALMDALNYADPEAVEWTAQQSIEQGSFDPWDPLKSRVLTQ